MKKQKEYDEIEEIIADVGWNGIIDMIRSGKLGFWLNEYGYEYENNLLADYFQKETFSDVDLVIRLFDIFNIKEDMLTLNLIKAITQVVQEQRKRFHYIGIAGNSKWPVVTTQRELMQALVKSPECIYLCNNDFRLPLSKKNITYIGKENAVVTLANDENINFAEFGITLQDTMIFRLHEIVVADNNLVNVKVLPYEDTSKENLFLFYDLSLGRNFFETKEEFFQRVSALQEIKIGTIFLRDEDYDIQEKRFYICIHGDISFLDYITDFTFKKKLWFPADAAMAKDLYQNQRKSTIYALFDTDGDKIYISKLHIHFLKYGTVNIFHDEENDSIPSSLGRGYGLYLI